MCREAGIEDHDIELDSSRGAMDCYEQSRLEHSIDSLRESIPDLDQPLDAQSALHAAACRNQVQGCNRV